MNFQALKYTFLYNIAFPFAETYHALKWFMVKQPPVPYFLKLRIIKKYQKEYTIRTFIETGTYLGTMVNLIKDRFEKIHTIEIDSSLYKNAKKRFKNFRKIVVSYGDSTIVIPKLLKSIHAPCMFWLDAHYSGGLTSKGRKNTPILEELSAILRHKVKTHIILIDNACNLAGDNEYDTIHEVQKYLTTKAKYVDVKIIHNVLIICPR